MPSGKACAALHRVQQCPLLLRGDLTLGEMLDNQIHLCHQRRVTIAGEIVENEHLRPLRLQPGYKYITALLRLMPVPSSVNIEHLPAL